jgi:capsular exopolysaccharide synthesis family protein
VPVAARRGHVPSTGALARSSREAFRTLQIQLDRRRKDPVRSETVIVTSASSSDGKTSTAVNLSIALIAAGHRVILIDCDLRHPGVESQLGLEPSGGLAALLTSPVRLSELLQTAPMYPPLQVLPASASGPRDVALLPVLARRMPEILEEAMEMADYVVLDTAPLGEVADALAIAGHADRVLLVARPHHTDRQALMATLDLLERADVPPTGWVVIGDNGGKLPTGSSEYGRGEDARRRGGSTSRSPA